jgi:hypothetical protein
MSTLRIPTKQHLKVDIRCAYGKNTKVQTLIEELIAEFTTKHSDPAKYKFEIEEGLKVARAKDPNCVGFILDGNTWEACFSIQNVPAALDIKLHIANEAIDKVKIIKEFIDSIVQGKLKIDDQTIELRISTLFGNVDVYKIYYVGSAQSWVAFVIGTVLLVLAYLTKYHYSPNILANAQWVYDVVFATIPAAIVLFVKQKVLVWKK